MSELEKALELADKCADCAVMSGNWKKHESQNDMTWGIVVLARSVRELQAKIRKAKEALENISTKHKDEGWDMKLVAREALSALESK